MLDLCSLQLESYCLFIELDTVGWQPFSVKGRLLSLSVSCSLRSQSYFLLIVWSAIDVSSFSKTDLLLNLCSWQKESLCRLFLQLYSLLWLIGVLNFWWFSFSSLLWTLPIFTFLMQDSFSLLESSDVAWLALGEVLERSIVTLFSLSRLRLCLLGIL